MRNWQEAGNKTKCFVFGDINLNYGKWFSPDQKQEEMIELVQNQIETMGFRQLVNSTTRSWQHQSDSTLDHIWTNCQGRIINHFNFDRS